MAKYYTNENGKRTEFKVFIIHGHSGEWRTVKTFIEDILKIQTRAVIDEVGTDVLINEVRKAVWDCECAVAIMSGDDILADNVKYARPNVMIEIGYTMGFYDHLYWRDNDLNPVLLIREKDTHIPTDLSGIKHEVYDSKTGIQTTLLNIGKFIEQVLQQVKEYYDE